MKTSTVKPNSTFPKMSKCDVTARSMPHFTLLAKDNFTPILVREWISLAEANGVPASKLNEARKLLANIEEYRRQNPVECKIPD